MGQVRHKTNVFSSGNVSGQRRSSHFVPWGDYSINLETNSEDSLGTVNGQLNGRWSGGGAWFFSRHVTTHSKGKKNTVTVKGEWAIAGPTSATVPSEWGQPSEASLKVDGTSAIANSLPTNPIAGLSVTLAELKREGLPSPLMFNTWRERTARAKSAGDEYLNYQFGWAPLVGEINRLAYVADNWQRILEEFQAKANKPIKVSFQWPVRTETVWQPTGFSTQPANAGPVNGSGSGQITRLYQRKWFEAEYVYHVPTGNDMSSKVQRHAAFARKLLGLELTPEVVWNLTPWSWAADWVGNVGDIAHNLSAFRQDGLVMRHAYIMCHTRREVTQSAYSTDSSARRVKVDEYKTRIPASPYGFGVSYDGLTPRQVAIITALGISRW